MTRHASERLRLRLEELTQVYGIEIVGKVRRAIDQFCNSKDIRSKKVDGEESYCMWLNGLTLVIIFTTTGDVRKIITLFPTNKRSSRRKVLPTS
ncbi:hypothetical protein [Stygiolobus caldivivus]|uniref:DUF4258 domain-containing protein n=1 Tax=Stygiolobus caldivivus TaxID=2824673 RepID=A0A8D5ZJB1_9CREN|nr:hypothetical protein [Stygiolobus caldivivus]BCU70185.1 hypothetical protein KN1_14820 [Stygiolobus caldivivus]